MSLIHVDLRDELVHRGDHQLPGAAADYIHIVGGQGEDVRDLSQHRAAGGVPDLHSHQVSQEKAALRELDILPVDVQHGVAHGQSTVDIGDALQLQDDHVFEEFYLTDL